MNSLSRLSLVFGADHEDDVTAALIEHQPALPGFTLVRAEGHSEDFGRASLHERVRGRVQRRVLWMVLPREQIDAVLESVAARVSPGSVLWWTEPVEAVGRLS